MLDSAGDRELLVGAAIRQRGVWLRPAQDHASAADSPAATRMAAQHQVETVFMEGPAIGGICDR